MGEGGSSATSCETALVNPDSDSLPLSPNELAGQLRLLRLAPEFQDMGYSPDSVRVCNNCGLTFPWKRTELNWVYMANFSRDTWYLGTIFEK